MASVADDNLSQEDRHVQARKVWRFWKDLQDRRHLGDWTYEEIQHAKAKALGKLVDRCAPEIIEAVLENPPGCILSGLRITISEGRIRVTDNQGIIWDSVHLAAKTVTKHCKTPIHTHVKICMAEALRNAIVDFDDWFYKAEAQDLLPLFMSMPRPAVVRMGEHLNRKQCGDLRTLLYRQLGNRPILVLLDREPEEQRRWLLWHLWHLQMAEPEVKRALGGVPRALFVIGEETWPTNKDGELLDPLGVIHAQALMTLGGELNKHGPPIEQPQSKSRLARSYGVSRSTVDKLLQSDVRPKLTPDGTGGVGYKFTSDQVIGSIETVKNIRRGRRKKR